MPVIDGQVRLDLKQLNELVAQLKEAKKQGEDVTKRLDDVNKILDKFASQGFNLGSDMQKSLKEIGASYDKLANNEYFTRIGQIRHEIRTLQKATEESSDKAIKSKLRELEAEEKLLVKAKDINYTLQTRMKQYKDAETPEEKDVHYKALVTQFDYLRDKYVEKSTLDLVKPFSKLEDPFDLTRMYAIEILEKNKAITLETQLQIEDQKKLNKEIERMKKGIPTADELLFPPEYFEQFQSPIMVKHISEVETAYSKVIDKVKKYIKASKAITTLPPNLTIDQLAHRDSLISSDEQPGIAELTEIARLSQNTDEGRIALRKLNMALVEYSDTYKTVAADEIALIEEITNLNIVKSNQHTDYGQQTLRVAQRIIDRTNEEIDLRKRLLDLDKQLKEGKITQEQYEEVLGIEALKQAYFNIERFEERFTQLRHTLGSSGTLTEVQSDTAQSIVYDMEGILKEATTKDIVVDDSSKIALMQMVEVLERFKGTKGALVENLIEPLNQLTSVDESKLESIRHIIGDLADPTSSKGAHEYAENLGNIIDSYSKSLGDTEKSAELHTAIRDMSAKIAKEYLVLKEDKTRLAELDENHLVQIRKLNDILYHERNLEDGILNAARLQVSNTLVQHDLVIKEIEAIEAKEAKQRKADNAKKDRAQKYHVDEEAAQEKQKLFEISSLKNVTLLRDSFDKLQTVQKMWGADVFAGKEGAAKITQFSAKELTDTINELNKLETVLVEVEDKTKEIEMVQVVQPDQISLLEKIRSFLIENLQYYAGTAEESGLTKQNLQATILQLTEIIKNSRNYNDELKNTKQSVKDLKEEAKESEAETKKGGGLLEKIVGKVTNAVKMVVMYRVVREGLQKIRQSFQFMIKSAVEYEQAMADVIAVSSASSIEINRLHKTVLDAANTTRYTSVQVADALYFMAQAGYKTTEAVEALNGTLLLAQATNKGVEQTAELMAATFRQFNLETDEATRVANIYAASINKSMSSLDKLAVALKQAGPVAGAMNLSIEETVGVLDLMFDRGIQGSRAGRALRNAFADMANPASNLAKKLDELGLDFSKVNLANNSLVDSLGYLQDAGLSAGQILKMFGKVIGTQMVAILTTSKEELNKYVSEVTNTTHAHEAAEIQIDTLRGDMDRLKASFSATGSLLGKVVNPIGRGFVGILTAISDGIGSVVEALFGEKSVIMDFGDSIEGLTKSKKSYSDTLKVLQEKTDDLATAERNLLEVRLKQNEVEYLSHAKAISDEFDKLEEQTVSTKKLSEAYERASNEIRSFAELMLYAKGSQTASYGEEELQGFYDTFLKAQELFNSFRSNTKKEIRKSGLKDEFMSEFKGIFEDLGRVFNHEFLSVVTQSEMPLEDFLSFLSGLQFEKGFEDMLFKIPEALVKAEKNVKSFGVEFDKNIRNLALLYNKGIIDDGVMAIWNDRLQDAVRSTAEILRKTKDINEEGVYLTFDLEHESFDKFIEKVETFFGKLKDELKGSDFKSSFMDAYEIELKAIEEVKQSQAELIEERYQSNLNMIYSTHELNEEADESTVIANELSRNMAILEAQYLRIRETVGLNMVTEIQINEILYDRNKKMLDYEEKQKNLTEQRAKKLAEIHSMELTYVEKVSNLQKETASSEYYDTQLKFLKEAQKRELEEIKKQHEDKLKEIEDFKSDEEKELLKAMDAEIRIQTTLHENTSRKNYAAYQNELIDLNQELDEKLITVEEYNRRVEQARVKQRQRESQQERTHNRDIDNILKEYEGHKLQSTEASNKQIQATNEFYSNEELNAKEYHLLQLLNLEKDYAIKRLEVSSNKEYNDKDLKELVDHYNRVKALAKAQRDKDTEEFEENQKIALANKRTETSNVLELNDFIIGQRKELVKFNEEQDYKEKKNKKQFYNDIVNLAVEYYEETVSLATSFTDFFLQLDKIRLDKELRTIDKRLDAEKAAADERYIRALKEDGLLSEQSKKRLEELDAELEAAERAGDEEAKIAAETSLAKFFSDDWQHYEKLQSLDDAIKKARQSGSEEAIIKAEADKKKYESEKKYQDEKARLEEEAAQEKAELEYEYAEKGWKLQMFTVAADAAAAIAKAWTSPFPLNIFTVAAATAGGIASIAAHSAARPVPQFESGGIVLGSSEGTLLRAGERNRTELISNPEQMANLLLAIGNQGLQKESSMLTLIIQDNSKEQARYTVDCLNNSVFLLDPKKALKRVN